MPKRWLRHLLKKGDTGEAAKGEDGKRKKFFKWKIFRRKGSPARNSEPNIRDVVRQMDAERVKSKRLSGSHSSNRSSIPRIRSNDDLDAAFQRDVTADNSSKKNQIPFDEDDDDSLDPLNKFASTSLKPPENSNSDDASLDRNEVFDLEFPLPKPKKQFLESAMTAKSASDLGYVHATEPSNASKWKSKTDLKYEDDNGSLGDNELFENDEMVLSRHKFLDAAYTAKSISDLSFVFQAQNSNGQIDHNHSSSSLGDGEVFKLGSPIVRPKKQFLDAAMMARSMTDLNYVHSTQQSLRRRKSMTDLKFADDQSLGDNEAFEVEAFEPRPKKQFLEAALAAKSLSDLNFLYTANEAPTNDDSQRSHGSLGSPEGFALGSPIIRPKKQFLDAAMMAKSLSNINYVHADQAQLPRRKSLPDLKYADEESLGDNEELFENEEEPPTKNQFLDAALAAKSISDLQFVFSAAQQQDEEASVDADDGNHDGSLNASIELFELDRSNANPRRKKAYMAKSMSDFNYVHSVPAPRAWRRKSLTDLKYDDDRSLGNNELFDLDDDAQIVRPKKQFLEAALMAKSISDLKIMYLNKSTYSSSMDSESRDDISNVVPEHLLGLSQPYLFHSSDLHSIDNEDLFESKTDEQDPPERPLVKAALEAKAQQVESIIVISARDEPSVLSTDHSSEVVPEHLVIVNQPAKAHAHDNYSIEVEDIFEHPSGELRPRKPLLKAALEAQAQLEEKEVAEMFSKSMSHLGSERYFGASSASFYDLSKSVPDFSAIVDVPDHLAAVHQPRRALPTLDETSIDGDRLFDSPGPRGGRPSLLEAALRAKRASNGNLLQLEIP